MRTVAAFFLTVIVVAAIASLCTLQWATHRAPAPADAHGWLHRELELTAAQHQALEPIEDRFGERQAELTERLREADRDLARALGEDKAYTPRVAAAVEMIHHRMGDLQKASIEHLFAMRSVLSPEQGDKLLHLAQRSLETQP